MKNILIALSLAACTVSVTAFVGQVQQGVTSLQPLIFNIDERNRANAAIEPYPYLHGGAFAGPPQPQSPDPLVSYQWDAGVNETELQIYNMLPVAVSLGPSTPVASFSGLESVVNETCNVLVTGAGSIMVDFGVENAAWLEVDSPDLLPVDLPLLTLSVSEWTEAYQGKVLVPKQYNTTYRLETNSELYEGVRFGFVTLTAAPSQPFTITGIRAVSQAKVVNYTGVFEAQGDDMLTRIWYTAAYTVRLNLETDYFGAILMYRGDRFSWTGDAHVAQSASMTAFGNFDFVLANLLRTAADCNNIESYCLYWALSAIEYYKRSGDLVTLLTWIDNIDAKLEHAHDLWVNPTGLSFFGWDDRVGSGFANASTVESQFAYRFLAMRCWSAWASVATELGNSTAAAHWTGYYTAAAQAVRATWGPQWYTLLGVHAAADAINAAFAIPAEVSAILSAQLNDAVTVCSLSNFNQYWILQALGNSGALDRAVESIHRCWGSEVSLGATSFWEISHPDWATLLQVLQPMPYGNNGATSLCHPWSAGPTSWLSANIVGVTPRSAGYTSLRIAPHVSAGMTGIHGRVPTPRGAVGVYANEAAISLSIPAGCSDGTDLLLSELLLTRLGWTQGGGAEESVHVLVNGEDVLLAWDEGASASGPVFGDALRRSRVACLHVPTTGDIRITRTRPVLPSELSLATPFSPPFWPGRLQEVDYWTSGTWVGHFGAAGYALPGYNADASGLTSVPSFLTSIVTFGSSTDHWTDPVPDADPRALQNPLNISAPRSIGVWYNSMTTAVDLYMTTAAEGAVWYQVAVYVVDYDVGRPGHEGYGPRRLTVAALDRWTLNPAVPVQYADQTGNGVWFVFQYNRSLRIRVSQLEGDNAVMSALAFDTVQ